MSPFKKVVLQFFSRQNHNFFPAIFEVGVNAFVVTVETSSGASEKVFKAVRWILFIGTEIFSNSHFALNLTQGFPLLTKLPLVRIQYGFLIYNVLLLS